MTIWLVRHGHAGNRAAWSGDDDGRPLSEHGSAQADALRALLADRPVTTVVSSPSTRCIQTVAGVAHHHGLDVETDAALAEGTDGSGALARVLAAATAGDVVACSHGDVIPAMLRRAAAAGMRAEVPDVVEKGSVWELEVVDGAVRSGTYHGVPVVGLD